MEKSPIDFYLNVDNEALSGRELESHVLLSAAAVLLDCQLQWGDPGQEERFEKALRYNQRLWTFLQTELTDAACKLPEKLKQDLLNLSSFIDKRTISLLANPEREKLDILVNINRNLAEGLAGHPA